VSACCLPSLVRYKDGRVRLSAGASAVPPVLSLGAVAVLVLAGELVVGSHQLWKG
jgi:hypothetical protein